MRNQVISYVRLFLCTVVLPLTAASCGSVFDDLPPCESGVRMRFVYDYNLEEANAFYSQVDCLTLHLYDSEGRLISTSSHFSDQISEESWRLPLELTPGNYHAVAYGGIACEEASFAHIPEPSTGSHFNSISMQLKGTRIGTRLHDHFHGVLDFTVSDESETIEEVTLKMTKTTNNFRILLKQLNDETLHGEDFEFIITDDNKELDHRNVPVISGHDINYPSWTSGDVEELAYAEISTSRLHLSTEPHLIVRDLRNGGTTTIDLPLLPYLLMTKSESKPWGNQEYLDRCSSWNMTFFLDANRKWANTEIIINGWTVRINDIEQ